MLVVVELVVCLVGGLRILRTPRTNHILYCTFARPSTFAKPAFADR